VVRIHQEGKGEVGTILTQGRACILTWNIPSQQARIGITRIHKERSTVCHVRNDKFEIEVDRKGREWALQQMMAELSENNGAN